MDIQFHQSLGGQEKERQNFAGSVLYISCRKTKKNVNSRRKNEKEGIICSVDDGDGGSAPCGLRQLLRIGKHGRRQRGNHRCGRSWYRDRFCLRWIRTSGGYLGQQSARRPAADRRRVDQDLWRSCQDQRHHLGSVLDPPGSRCLRRTDAGCVLDALQYRTDVHGERHAPEPG